MFGILRRRRRRDKMWGLLCGAWGQQEKGCNKPTGERM
jgi:hypothetical protein